MPDEYVTTGAAWFTLSLINAGLAQSKGRSGLGWWVVSLLLGPIATLIIVAWSRLEPGQRELSSVGTRAALIGAGVVLLVIITLVGLSTAGSTP